MAIKTYQFKFQGKTISVKGKKSNVEEFASRIQEVNRVPSMVREISGIIGGEEHSWTSISLFGPSGTPLADPDGYAAEVKELAGELPESLVETIDNPIMVDLMKKAADIVKRHTPVKDNRETPEAHNVRMDESRRFQEEQEAKRRERDAEEQEEAATLVTRYKYLAPLAVSGKSRHAGGADNLKTELVRAFPGVSFSVKSETYSMGSSLNVRWTDGPTVSQVKEFSDKYQTKSFDGMTDSTTNVSTVFNTVFGGAGYVHENREVSETLLIETAAKEGLEFTAEEWQEFVKVAHQDHETTEIHRNIVNKAHETSKLPDISTVPHYDHEQTQESNEDITVRMNSERNGVEILFNSKPDRSVIDSLKSNGFRWSPRGKLWYAKQSPSRISFAHDLQHAVTA